MTGEIVGSCETCVYSETDWDVEPCESCTGANNHYKSVDEEDHS